MKTKILNFIQNLLFIVSILICVFILAQKFIFKETGVFGYRTYVIITSSMSPHLEVGDVIVVKSVPASEIKAGDIVTYIGKESDFKGKIVTHMVKDVEVNEKGEYLFYTKGTVTNMVDPVVKEDQIYGKMVFRLFLISLVSKLIRSKIGFFILIFVPLVIILIKQLLNIRKEVKNEKNDDTDKIIKEYKDKKKKEKKNKKKMFSKKEKVMPIVEIKDATSDLEKTIYSKDFRDEIQKELDKTIIIPNLKNEIENKIKEESKTITPTRGLENTLINSNLKEEIEKIEKDTPDIIYIEE